MSRTYISSTYEDLVEERRAAREAILALGHFPVGMEDYAASDERPLDRCLRDVRSSQAYIGIFAWKYGFRPASGEKSITQLEYEEAVAHNVPCYLYLLAEDAPWPRTRIPDEDQPRIKALRERLKSERVIGSFRDSSSLARAILQSLATSMPRSSDKPAIPEILPYLCDRSDQEFTLAEAIKQSKAKPEHPLLCITHGEETEAHDKFLERLQKVILPQLLPHEAEQAGVQLYHLEWPPSFRTPEEMHRRLEMCLSKEVLDSAVGMRHALNDRFRQSLGPIACHSHLISETWQQQRVAGLDSFVQFWNEWPELAVGQQLFAFLFIKYQVNKSLGPYKLRRYRRIHSEIRETLNNFEFGRFDRITAVVLPELKGPTLSESADWARSNETAKFCDPDALVTALFEYYAEWEAREQSKIIPIRIPTDQLVRKLRELMSRTQLQEGRTA